MDLNEKNPVPLIFSPFFPHLNNRSKVRHPPSTNQHFALNLPVKRDLDFALAAGLFTWFGLEESG